MFTALKHHGGIAPQPRKHRAGSLALAEREEISRGLSAGHSCRAIAAALGRAVSTISREVNKNGGRDAYRDAARSAVSWQPCKPRMSQDREGAVLPEKGSS
ncbi:helix-turn-helix domain-containing protein [Saccharopolyspora shandongensis]